MAPDPNVLYRRAFLDRDAPMVLPVVPGVWVLLLLAVVLDGRVLAAAASPLDVQAWLDPGLLALVGFAVVALVVGSGLLAWYVIDGIPTVYSLHGNAIVRRNGGLLGRARAIPLDAIARVHAYSDPRLRSSPFRVDLVLRDGRRVRWAVVNRKRRERLDRLVAALSDQLPVDDGPPGSAT